jgi:hypothetical protein
MTDQPQIQPPPFQVTPRKNSRLEQLHAVYADAKAKADQATSDLKTVTDAIKAEMTKAAPDQARLELVGPHGPRLTLTYVESWRVDATRLKAEAPETYVMFAKKRGSWQLKAARGGES